MNHIQQAIEFRSVFNQKNLSGGERYLLPESFRNLKTQLKLIKEEGDEFNQALEDWVRLLGDQSVSGDSLNAAKEHVLKELADLTYVCYQMAAFLGVDLDVALDRVHQSNMSKLDKSGKAIYRKDGKVLKGPNYREPFLSDLV